MQHTVQSAVFHELANQNQIRRIVCATQHRQYVWMREYAKLWEFVDKRVRRPTNHAAARIVAQIQELGHNFGVLPDSFERVAGRCGGYFFFESQIFFWDSAIF